MNSALRKDIIQWDVRTWSIALDYWEKQIHWPDVKSALELGGREGGLSLWLSLKGIDTICSDLSDVAKTATPLHKRYEQHQRIAYVDINATSIPYENHFDVVVFKSIAGGVGHGDNFGNQQKLFQQIHKSLKPGGHLLFAENLVSSPLHRWMRKRFIQWGHSWRYIHLDEMPVLLKDFATYDMHCTGVSATFGRNEKQRTMLSYLDTTLFNWVCPKRWKYMVYGVARK